MASKTATKKRARVGTAEKLLQAAARDFAIKGYEGASLEGIASAVGIKAPSIFKHFAGKRALYDAILGEIQETLAVPAEQFMSLRGDPIEALLVVWEYYWDFCESHPYYAALLFREAFDADSPRLDGLRLATDFSASLTRAYIHNAQEAGQLRDFDPDGHLFWALSYPMTFFAVPGLRTHLWQAKRARPAARKAKAAFLEAAKHFLTP